MKEDVFEVAFLRLGISTGYVGFRRVFLRVLGWGGKSLVTTLFPSAFLILILMS
jgi:hypothetical protein